METGEIRLVTRDARGSYAIESPTDRPYFSKPESELGLSANSLRAARFAGSPQSGAPQFLFVVRNEGTYYMEREPRSIA